MDDARRSMVLVIPCYNEAKRLSTHHVTGLLCGDQRLSVLLVDDGSRDGTRELLLQLQVAHRPRVDLLLLPSNRGKAEALRAGLNRALERAPWAVGYADADFSTPVEEIVRLVSELHTSGAQAILGSRVMLLGTRIARRPARHYLGRLFATAAALALQLPVYDTQCGAKVFRCGPALRAALAQPFEARWAFDVELLARLLSGPPGARLSAQDIREMPLRVWHEVPGSKVRPWHAFGALLELARVARRVRRSPASSPGSADA